MLKKISGVLISVAGVMTPVASFAALSTGDQASILAGISASDTVFYAIGGGILVVLAGIWGFKKVQGLMSGR